MLISVIIPCYNASKTIERAIDSVVTQTYKDFEIIIVDDGSSDNSKGVIDKLKKAYRDVSIYYYYQSNFGPATARNYGVSVSKGSLIAFLDADDTWHPEKLFVQVRTIQQYNIRFVGASFTYDDFEEVGYCDFREVQLIRLLFYNCFPTPGVMMERSLFDELGGFDENLRYAEDYDLWLRAVQQTKLVLIKNPKLVRLYKFAFGKKGLSSHMYSMFRGEKKVYLKLYRGEGIRLLPYIFLINLLRCKLVLRLLISTLLRGKNLLGAIFK